MTDRTVRYEQWDALVELFGPANIEQTRGVYSKVASEFKKGHYSYDQIVKAGKVYQRDHKDWAFTPTALLKHADQLLHIERRPATSHVATEDDRPGISLKEYAQTPEGKQDPNLDALRDLWRRQHHIPRETIGP